MPERVTREEKIVELAILKARKTIEALRDGENTELDIVKLKRPKAKATKHGIKQDQIHANAGGEEFTSGKIKKMSEDEIRAKRRYSTNLVHQLDAQIKRKEKEFEGRKMNPAQKRTLKMMKARVEALYGALTLMAKQKYPSYKEDEKMAKFNEATDREEDARDVKFSREGQQSADEIFASLDAVIRKVTSKLLTATGKQLAKLEEDLAEAVSDLKATSKYFGRSS